MSDERETIEVRLVPVHDEDVRCLADAHYHLGTLERLLDRDDWRGAETMEGLRRLQARIDGYGVTYTMPMPVSRHTRHMKPGEPLFTREGQEE